MNSSDHSRPVTGVGSFIRNYLTSALSKRVVPHGEHQRAVGSTQRHDGVRPTTGNMRGAHEPVAAKFLRAQWQLDRSGSWDDLYGLTVTQSVDDAVAL